jgi:hypothetical protein
MLMVVACHRLARWSLTFAGYKNRVTSMLPVYSRMLYAFGVGHPEIDGGIGEAVVSSQPT